MRGRGGRQRAPRRLEAEQIQGDLIVVGLRLRCFIPRGKSRPVGNDQLFKRSSTSSFRFLRVQRGLRFRLFALPIPPFPHRRAPRLLHGSVWRSWLSNNAGHLSYKQNFKGNSRRRNTICFSSFQESMICILPSRRLLRHNEKHLVAQRYLLFVMIC